MNETEFGPSVKLSRGQFATILYRMENEPEAWYDAAAFPDVSDGQFYTGPAMWAKDSGVISGYDDGRFGHQSPSCTSTNGCFISTEVVGESSDGLDGSPSGGAGGGISDDIAAQEE